LVLLILNWVRFEAASVPTGALLAGVTGLDTLFWRDAPQGLVLLRNSFKEAGMRKEERQTTFSLMRSSRRNEGGVGGWLQYIFFEATSSWGMSPARPLWLLVGFIPLFGLFYARAIAYPSGGGAVWRVWDKERTYKGQGREEPEQLHSRGIALFGQSFFFSTLSAFHIGWREFNVGSWISRLNPHEYILRGTGWVRTLSGIQSLISVYLLALAVLTYFGRPFG
jgi:hypothetical protein